AIRRTASARALDQRSPRVDPAPPLNYCPVMGSAELDALRAKIHEIEGRPMVVRRRFPTGVPAFDALTDGLPKPGIVELAGPEGTGRCRAVLAVLAAATRDREAVAWVDPLQRFFPPSADDHGVQLERLLVVRPVEDGQSPWLWATEQLLRSGCFRWVVVDWPGSPNAPRNTLQRWARAAETGDCTAIVLATRATQGLPADLRFAVSEGELVLVRDRTGTTGRVAPLPPPPLKADPWG
ncbi:MAG: hypothetical protein AAF602_28560, partial [Myxococcota bacterium]